MASTEFTRELYQSLNQYFKAAGISKYANNAMLVKLGVALVWWSVSLVLLFTVEADKATFTGLYIFHCFAQLFILLNIAHDANHGAIFRNKRLKNILKHSFDLCGVNSYMWRELHHAQHHYCMNIDGEDETLIARKLFRFTDTTRWKLMYRLQHYYFVFFYGLFTADWVLTKDFECFFFPHTQYLKEKKHPTSEYVKLFVWKTLYIGYMIFLPIFLLDFSFWFVFALFMLGQFSIGVIGGLVIQITHPLTDADFPKSKMEYEHFAYHVFATTADYSVNSIIAKCFFGGLNLHVAHHLCPNVCHTHYPALTRLVKDIAQKHGVDYRVNKTMPDAIRDHFIHLKSLSRADTDKQLSYEA